MNLMVKRTLLKVRLQLDTQVIDIYIENLFIMGGTPSKIVDSLLEDTNFDRDEIERLRKRFMKLDRDSSGSIDKNEFMSIPGVSSNPLAARIMEVFDTDNSGDVDFQEFITGLSIFSGRGSKDDKLNFAFKIYDIDKDGYISNGELFIVLKIMVGNNLDDEQLQQIVDRTIMENDSDGDGRLDFQEFKNAIETTEVIKSLTLKYDV
ncbi:Calcineurin subunit B [Maudiozyma exigua]|nr:Calcineurin subunit B [Kazachstania exigua]